MKYPDPRDHTGQKVSHQVFIGNAYAARNLDWLRDHNISHVVSLIGEPPKRLAGIHYRIYDLEDNSKQPLIKVIYDVHNYITRRLKPTDRVLVHCAAGVSRSATVVIGHLLLTHPHLRLRDAEKRVRKARPVIQPNANFERQLRRVADARPFSA